MEYVDVKMENPFGTAVFSVHPFFLRSHTNGKMSPPLKRCNYLPQESLSFLDTKRTFCPNQSSLKMTVRLWQNVLSNYTTINHSIKVLNRIKGRVFSSLHFKYTVNFSTIKKATFCCLTIYNALLLHFDTSYYHSSSWTLTYHPIFCCYLPGREVWTTFG